jgi:hypothetical protein
MLSYARTVSSSIIVSSYAIGPLDPVEITTLHTQLSTGEEYSLLVPIQLPPSILTHPMFKDAYECGYEVSDPEEEWTVPKLVNEVYQTLVELYYEDELVDYCPWTLGFLLGELEYLAERDQTLALTGLAHYCFLLSFFPLDSVPPWPLSSLVRVRFRHGEVLRTYRAQVRSYRVQAKNFAEAQRLALAGSAQ